MKEGGGRSMGIGTSIGMRTSAGPGMAASPAVAERGISIRPVTVRNNKPASGIADMQESIKSPQQRLVNEGPVRQDIFSDIKVKTIPVKQPPATFEGMYERYKAAAAGPKIYSDRAEPKIEVKSIPVKPIDITRDNHVKVFVANNPDLIKKYPWPVTEKPAEKKYEIKKLSPEEVNRKANTKTGKQVTRTEPITHTESRSIFIEQNRENQDQSPENVSEINPQFAITEQQSLKQVGESKQITGTSTGELKQLNRVRAEIQSITEAKPENRHTTAHQGNQPENMSFARARLSARAEAKAKQTLNPTKTQAQTEHANNPLAKLEEKLKLQQALKDRFEPAAGRSTIIELGYAEAVDIQEKRRNLITKAGEMLAEQFRRGDVPGKIITDLVYDPADRSVKSLLKPLIVWGWEDGGWKNLLKSLSSISVKSEIHLRQIMQNLTKLYPAVKVDKWKQIKEDFVNNIILGLRGIVTKKELDNKLKPDAGNPWLPILPGTESRPA